MGFHHLPFLNLMSICKSCCSLHPSLVLFPARTHPHVYPRSTVIHREDIHVVTTSADDVHHYKARLIQLETWSDYNGYGFNMHSIKGKTGEYIGKVEHGSPSHVSGMKEGDRIIEVSGSSIADDTHNDVVGKIKAAGGRALMLVVDAETDKYYQERSIELNGNMPNIARHDCPMTKPEGRWPDLS